RRINHPKEVVQPGQEVEATVLRIDPAERKIALSMAASADGSPEEVEAAVRQHAAPTKSFGTFGDLLSKLKK
ncbi:MAG: S1 RNA-binding domain-containing protein, partial [Myxococcales bacterium]|nr:S1 RNA-binding domain-containing protein [Myxococcales bacterium]